MPAAANNTEAPLVSVCVLTYNHAAYIGQCLDSLLMQKTDFPFEICIGEDDSSDGTRKICQSYADKHPNKIRLFLRSRKDVIYRNGQATGKYNGLETLKSCRGEYIAACDGDDYWTDDEKLRKQVRALEKNPDCSLCFCNVRVEYEDGKPSHPGYISATEKKKLGRKQVGFIEKPSRPLDITDLAKSNFIHTPSVLFKNWIKTEHLPDYLWSARLADWALHMNTARFGKLLFVDAIMATYRVHPKGCWSSTEILHKYGAVLSTTRAILDSGLFPESITRIMKNKILKRINQVWKQSVKENDPEKIGSLLTLVASEYPELMQDAVRVQWKNDCRYLLYKLLRTRSPLRALGKKGS